MKPLKIAAVALFALATITNANAQDSDNPWGVSFGVNAVDIRGNRNLSDLAKDYLGTKDWDVSVSGSVTRYLEKGFSLQLGASINKVKTPYAEMKYYSVDANVKYDVNNLVKLVFGGTTSYFDPYVYLGGSYVYLGGQKEAMLNAGAGFNVWFNENIGLNIQTGAKHNFSGKVADHFQHTFGVVYKFGGKDTDKDGIYDKDDKCPEVPGLAAFNGCPDTDADGIEDSKDSCPKVAGLAALNGCPDADADGIADKDDMCPTEKGTSANRGCPDADADGVVNKDDKCPNVAGPAANGGCPWPDTDGDSVLDKDDKCINEAGVASNNGCPAPVISEAGIETIDLGAKSILFNSGRSTFRPQVSKDLDALVAVINQFPKATFAIGGYTDSTGSDKINAKISQNRADAAMNYFVEKGIDASRLTAKGHGSVNPIDSNKTRAGRANNRRVEIKVSNKK